MNNKKTMSKQALIIIGIIIMSVVLFTTTTLAWFVASSGYTSNLLFHYIGDTNVVANIYIGNDSNRDGLLEETHASITRGNKVEYQYTEANKTTQTIHREVALGSILTFKIIVINDRENSYSVVNSMNFDDMQSYFFEYWNGSVSTIPDDESDSDLVKLLGANSSRILFKLVDLKVRIYSDGENNTDLANAYTEGYDNLIRTSVASEAVGTVTQITSINTLTSISDNSLDYNLWQISNKENIVDDIQLNVNELMEIDFVLTSLMPSEIASEYRNYALANYAQDSNNNYVNDMVNAELSYFTSEIGEKQFDFIIKKIFIVSKNMAGGE